MQNWVAVSLTESTQLSIGLAINNSISIVLYGHNSEALEAGQITVQ